MIEWWIYKKKKNAQRGPWFKKSVNKIKGYYNVDNAISQVAITALDLLIPENVQIYRAWITHQIALNAENVGV